MRPLRIRKLQGDEVAVFTDLDRTKSQYMRSSSLTKLKVSVSPKEKVGTRSVPWRMASFTKPFLSLKINRISPPFFGSPWFSTSLAPPTTKTAAVPLGPLKRNSVRIRNLDPKLIVYDIS